MVAGKNTLLQARDRALLRPQFVAASVSEGPVHASGLIRRQLSSMNCSTSSRQVASIPPCACRTARSWLMNPSYARPLKSHSRGWLSTALQGS